KAGYVLGVTVEVRVEVREQGQSVAACAQSSPRRSAPRCPFRARPSHQRAYAPFKGHSRPLVQASRTGFDNVGITATLPPRDMEVGETPLEAGWCCCQTLRLQR